MALINLGLALGHACRRQMPVFTRVLHRQCWLKPRVPSGSFKRLQFPTSRRVCASPLPRSESTGLKKGVENNEEQDDSAAGPDGFQNLRPSILRPAVFALAVAFGSYYGAAYLTRNEAEKLEPFTGKRAPSSYDLQRAKKAQAVEEIIRKDHWLRSHNPPRFVVDVYVEAAEWWLGLSEGKKVCAGVIAANAAIFLLWQIPHPRVQLAMRRWFLHWPLSGRSVTLLTSVFSHKGIVHFSFNMIALYTIGSAAVQYLASSRSLHPSQLPSRFSFGHDTLMDHTANYHFIAFFIAAGLFSGLVSHTITLAVRLPRLIRSIESSSGLQRQAGKVVIIPPNTILPGLGASGAIYSALVLTAFAYPDASVYLILFPFVPIQIGWGVVGIVTFDILGLIRGWRSFDHWAHLAGAAFGAWYYWYGPRLWRRLQHLEASTNASNFLG